MNKNNVPLNKLLKHEWKELDIACKAVLIIGVFLLIQLICAIFVPAFSSQPTINAIFQTSLSSIFGYILGMNIPHGNNNSPPPKKDSNSETPESNHEISVPDITREIFSQEIEPQTTNQEIDSDSHLTRGEQNEDTETDSKSEDPVLNTETPLLKGTSIRVLFAAGVCLICLIALMVITLTNQNNYTDENTYTEGIIQVGHLISTTIGFLISNTSHQH